MFNLSTIQHFKSVKARPIDRFSFDVNFQVSELNNDLVRTRADRLRAAMCPETLDDGASYVGTQYEEGELTCVQRLSEPSQALF